MKVWLDKHQYKVIDVSSNTTAGEMGKVIAGKVGSANNFEMLLEISLTNGGMQKGTEAREGRREGCNALFSDKSTRKMDENEYIHQVLDKHKNYSTRLMWMATTNTESQTTADKPDTKVQ